MSALLAAALLALAPGAVIFHAPFGDRDRRNALPLDERVFWVLVLGLLVSTLAGLTLAIGGWYRFERVLWADAGVAALALALARGRLRVGRLAGAPRWTFAVPVALLLLGWWITFRVPPAEYVMGGRDPGTYMLQGLRIAQRGGVAAPDDLARALPPLFRPLFFPPAGFAGTYTQRFMAFFLLDPDAGTVVGQFPPGFPVWIAIGYGLNGLSGARAVPGVAALLGVLAVYFAGARLFGRAAAGAGAALLSLNVAQVWYSRDPNAEILLQPMLFAGLLAYVRAVNDEDVFFAPVAALLFVVGGFTHLTGLMAAAGMAAVVLLQTAGMRRPVPRVIPVVLVIGSVAAGVFLWRFIPPYFEAPVGFFNNLTTGQLLLAAAGALAGIAGLLIVRSMPPATRDRSVGLAVATLVWALASYAYFFRRAGGTLAAHDADSLRTLSAFYLSPYVLAAAAVGVAVAARRFEIAAPFLLLYGALSTFFLYKIRIVPEHFWAARRFIALIIPGTLLLAGAAAFASCDPCADVAGRPRRRPRITRAVIGLLFLAGVAFMYARGSRPILEHVEYAGLIPQLETLAAEFGDDDLVLVESRGNSDVHVLAMPLAYVYDRNVLVFAAMAPPKESARAFIAWAHARYKRVFFMGSAGGGVDLLWRSLRVGDIRTRRFQVPEYEPAVNAYPQGVKHKEFDLVLYEFLREPVTDSVLTVDVGGSDDPYVRGFHAKEGKPGSFTFRWTRDASSVAIVGIRPDHREIVLRMSAGGRPPAAGPATVHVWLDDVSIGTVMPGPGLEEYRVALPPALAARLGRIDTSARLRLDTVTWSPSQVVRGSDVRDLGVMLDRIEVH